MTDVVLLDSDTLSELSRGNARVTDHAKQYLDAHGCLTISAVTVFERLRGYRAAIAAGRPFEEYERAFRRLIATCRVVPLDADAADHAANVWAQLGARKRKALGDILIAGTASAHDLVLATRNRRDFGAMAKLSGIRLRLTDWTKP